MAHPDLNELREKVRGQRSTRGIKAEKRKRGRKGYFLLVLLLFAISLSYLRIDVVKNHYTTAADFIAQLFEKTEKVGKEEFQSPVMGPLPTQYVLVQTKGANIRSGPGLDSIRVAVVGEGERLEYLNQFMLLGDIYWLHVQVSTGETGWISDKIVLWDKESMDLLVMDAEENVAAMLTLATFYEKGVAVDKFKERSLFWYERAALHGDEQSKLLIESQSE